MTSRAFVCRWTHTLSEGSRKIFCFAARYQSHSFELFVIYTLFIYLIYLFNPFLRCSNITRQRILRWYIPGQGVRSQHRTTCRRQVLDVTEWASSFRVLPRSWFVRPRQPRSRDASCRSVSRGRTDVHYYGILRMGQFFIYLFHIQFHRAFTITHS